MTSQSRPVLRRIQLLLNTLIGEHHVRKSLLSEVCDLLTEDSHVPTDVCSATADLLAALERGTDVPDFDSRVERISSVVGALVPGEPAAASL